MTLHMVYRRGMSLMRVLMTGERGRKMVSRMTLQQEMLARLLRGLHGFGIMSRNQLRLGRLRGTVQRSWRVIRIVLGEGRPLRIRLVQTLEGKSVSCLNSSMMQVRCRDGWLLRVVCRVHMVHLGWVRVECGRM